MQAAGKEHLLRRLEYPETGHLIEPPYSPHFRATNFIMDRRQGKGESDCPEFPEDKSRPTGSVVLCSDPAVGRTSQSPLRRSGGRLEQDLVLPAAAPVHQIQSPSQDVMVFSGSTAPIGASVSPRDVSKPSPSLIPFFGTKVQLHNTPGVLTMKDLHSSFILPVTSADVNTFYCV